MACWTQQGLTFGCYISFETITSDGDEGILYNLLDKQAKILGV